MERISWVQELANEEAMTEEKKAILVKDQEKIYIVWVLASETV